MFGGLKVFVIESWVRDWAWCYFTQPPVPPRGQRKGTRKQWKRAHAQGWRRRYVQVEPEHMLKTADGFFCTARQYAALKAAIPPVARNASTTDASLTPGNSTK